jgi:hypothetical protein
MDELESRFRQDFGLVHNDVAGFKFPLTRMEAWALVSMVQLACRHPENTGPTRQIAESVARRLQEKLSLTPALTEVLCRGWDPKFDG